MIFKLLDARTHRRLRQIQIFSSTTKMANFGQFKKGAKDFYVHIVSSDVTRED
ncbi:Uncharacterised protein [Vibrio cholerae]|uniref:Uncharacterized protein n=1 Tax=Vibrio cholerae TaxID=666 RepID=A0A655PW93_VIBCL|nr:Uncharacterised protein [Vibrio cholerae]CSA30433.1 Uncharacterised protein [Vibrio cholerae]CSA32142.1 Uncharacterised protein [Vibrio cholerae]CSA52886.1 Uncharacterised protein [Vibrio cholerae]CSB49169.1 Uncharacterised protein [Vibrio cholerae]